MEIYVVNNTPYGDYILEDHVKSIFKKYFPDAYGVHFGKEYPSEYYRWHLIIKVAPDGYIRVRATDKLVNRTTVKIGYVSPNISYSALGEYDYNEQVIFKISHLLELILKEYREHYESTALIGGPHYFNYYLEAEKAKAREVEPMNIDEIRYMMHDIEVTNRVCKYAKGENTMITRTEMLDRATKIKEVKFNPPATIVFWNDGTKTVVKSQDDEPFDPEKGLAMALIKKHFACNKGYYNNLFKKYCGDFKAEKPKKEPVKPSARPKVFTETAEQYSEEVKKQKQIGDGYDDIHWEKNQRGRK